MTNQTELTRLREAAGAAWVAERVARKAAQVAADAASYAAWNEASYAAWNAARAADEAWLAAWAAEGEK